MPEFHFITRQRCPGSKPVPSPTSAPARLPADAGRRVWICGEGEFTLPEAQRKLGLPYEVIRRRLDNGGGQCKDHTIYWAGQYLKGRR